MVSPATKFFNNAKFELEKNYFRPAQENFGVFTKSYSVESPELQRTLNRNSLLPNYKQEALNEFKEVFEAIPEKWKGTFLGGLSADLFLNPDAQEAMNPEMRGQSREWYLTQCVTKEMDGKNYIDPHWVGHLFTIPTNEKNVNPEELENKLTRAIAKYNDLPARQDSRGSYKYFLKGASQVLKFPSIEETRQILPKPKFLSAKIV
ncbi:MAG: hypothetical protein HRT47_13510 [Candidatus Caenarcaniphilales bacterium]|nr:hypothetical protein [Candidatus Caenarcaniphilales bacterium]